MPTNELVTRLTMSEMLFYFFNQHQTGAYNTRTITDYIKNNFDIPTDKERDQLHRQVSGGLSTFYHVNPDKERNFIRYKNLYSQHFEYLYEFEENAIVETYMNDKLTPKAETEETAQKPKEPTYRLKTVKQVKQVETSQQLSLDYEQKPSEEETLSPLMQDLKSADMLQTISSMTFEDLMRAIPDNTEVKFKRYDKDSFSITKIHIA